MKKINVERAIQVRGAEVLQSQEDKHRGSLPQFRTRWGTPIAMGTGRQ